MIGRLRPRVVVADELAPAGIEMLEEELDVVLATSPARLLQTLGEAQAVVVRSRTFVTADLLDRGPRLRLVGRAGIGIDNIDVPAASSRQILVINAPLGNVQSTAEHTMALLFAMARRIIAADTSVRSGAWKAGYMGTQLAGKRLGIIGIGRIGRRVASLAHSIGMEVVACDPYVPDEAWLSMPAERLGAEELLATSDVVTLHVSLTVETENMIGAEEIGAMKRGSYLINCARGGLVDDVALARALQEGHLAGAAVDVFPQEPPSHSPLLSAPNIILTPHVAATTREAQELVSTELAAQILDFFAGRPVAFPVNPSVLARATA
jgi:D-3-phosphoglycerate dehydrogenase / 2-oxoglutarate reductase